MNVTQKIKMDLLSKQNVQTIHAVHDDTNSRYVEISLFEGGIPWAVPENSHIAIAYLAANGANGIYDTLPSGADAYIYDENKISVILVPAALYPGITKITVAISDENGNQISTFPINVEVDENYSYGASKPETYINLRQWLSKELADMVIGSTTVTITQKGDELTADKGYAELFAAHTAGQTLYCKLPDGSVLALAVADENGLLFQGENCRDYQQIIIRADGTITYKSGKYALLGELVTDALIGVYPSATGDGYESTDDLADLQESYKSGRTLVCNLQIDDRGHLRLPMSKKADNAFYFSAVFEGKEYLVTITADGVTVEISECGGGNSGGNVDQSGLSTTAKNLLITILRNGIYSNDQSANITALENALASGGNEPDAPVVTTTSISATYSGGDVAVGTAVADLTGIVVTAHYSDGSTATVTGYSLSGEIAEGENTVTVTYQGKTATFTVTGIAESTGENNGWVVNEPYAIEWTDGYSIDNSSGNDKVEPNYSATGYIPCLGVSALDIVGIYGNYVYAYDAEQNYLGRISFNASYPTPVNREVAYVRFFCRTGDKSNASAIPRVYEELTESTAWEAGKYYRATYIEDTGLNEKTGATKANSNDWTSDYMLCYGAKTITTTPLGSATWRNWGVFYDADRNYISGGVGNYVPWEVPENAMYFRLCGKDGFEYTIQKPNRPWVQLA